MLKKKQNDDLLPEEPRGRYAPDPPEGLRGSPPACAGAARSPWGLLPEPRSGPGGTGALWGSWVALWLPLLLLLLCVYSTPAPPTPRNPGTPRACANLAIPGSAHGICVPGHLESIGK